MRKKCLEMVYKLAKKNKKVVFVGSDLGAGVLEDFKKNIPERFFMEGVSEQYLTGMVAGLAKEGFIPYFNTIATFITRRNFEQNMIDLGLHNLPVKLIGNGGGLVYAPLGPTHQAIEDISIMKNTAKGKLEIKASGGIKDIETAKMYIDIGVTRLGTSAGVSLITEDKTNKNQY